MFTTLRNIVAASVFVALSAAPALAQLNNKVAIGAIFSTRHAPDESSEVDGGHSVQFEWRIGHIKKSSWGWQMEPLNWFSTDVVRQVAGGPLDLGELHVRPVMGGYGYTRVINPRLTLTADFLAGFAFSSFEMGSEADTAYRTRLGASTLSADATNPFVVSPDVRIWYDLNQKLGLRISGSYVVARPEVTIHSSLGDERHSVHADVYTLRAGLVYRIF